MMAASQYAVAATVVVATPAILPQRCRARAKWAILQPVVWMGYGLVVSEGMRNRLVQRLRHKLKKESQKRRASVLVRH